MCDICPPIHYPIIFMLIPNIKKEKSIKKLHQSHISLTFHFKNTYVEMPKWVMDSWYIY